MKTLALAACVAASLALAGCATTDRQAVLKNLEGCERHYDGAISAGLTGAGFSGTVKIDCTPAARLPVVPTFTP